MALFTPDENYFGLDLGTNSIKLAQVRELHGSPSLITYGDIEVPANLLASDSDVDQQRVADLVKQLAEDAKVTTKNVVAALPGGTSYTAIVQVPKLNHDELAQSIKFQADKYIPMAIDQVKLDWAVVGDVPNSADQEVLLVAAPNNVAEKYLNIVQKAGLELMALEINSIAEARSLINRKTPDVCAMILDIGVNATDLAIVDHQAPRLVRSISVGSLAMQRVVGQNLGLDKVQADQFLKKFGLMQDKLEGQIYRTLKPLMDNLVEEIKKSTAFFREKNPSTKLEKIVLTGGTSALPELPMYLANATGMTVEIGNPWQNVSYPSEIQSSLASLSLNYATAIGLALRNFG
ncbi:type IV pilus assembly protein PilM [Candidatus Saccharibacteria bacterium]|nr:type IV pilus assembly protein PilM [Candidatus Saccharibacteria bacterium]